MSAIRARFLAAGLEDPTENMSVPYAILKAYQRNWTTKERRKPITVGMLVAMSLTLDYLTRADDAVLSCAIFAGFFLLLRISEIVGEDGATRRKGVRGSDFTPLRDGLPVASFAEANEVSLHIQGSKTDQLNRGEKRCYFPSGHPQVCLIATLKAMERHFPQRFAVEDADPLFRWSNGKPVLRIHIQAALEKAAGLMGVPACEIGTHSLRFGGASALWAAFGDTGLVRRWGRWKSDSFHGYLWDAQDMARGYAKGMMESNVTPSRA